VKEGQAPLYKSRERVDEDWKGIFRGEPVSPERLSTMGDEKRLMKKYELQEKEKKFRNGGGDVVLYRGKSPDTGYGIVDRLTESEDGAEKWRSMRMGGGDPLKRLGMK